MALSLFGSIYFFSCDKNNAESLCGTIWKSDRFEGKVIDETEAKEKIELLLRSDNITISFLEREDREKYHFATIKFNNVEFYNPVFNAWRPLALFSSVAKYTFKRNRLTLKFSEDIMIFSDQNWTGKVENDKMILENVFGATVEFRKL